jgi:hypothetical protein
MITCSSSTASSYCVSSKVDSKRPQGRACLFSPRKIEEKVCSDQSLRRRVQESDIFVAESREVNSFDLKHSQWLSNEVRRIVRDLPAYLRFEPISRANRIAAISCKHPRLV